MDIYIYLPHICTVYVCNFWLLLLSLIIVFNVGFVARYKSTELFNEVEIDKGNLYWLLLFMLLLLLLPINWLGMGWKHEVCECHALSYKLRTICSPVSNSVVIAVDSLKNAIFKGNSVFFLKNAILDNKYDKVCQERRSILSNCEYNFFSFQHWLETRTRMKMSILLL